MKCVNMIIAILLSCITIASAVYYRIVDGSAPMLLVLGSIVSFLVIPICIREFSEMKRRAMCRL